MKRRGDLHPDLPAIRAVGYRQLWQHLAGECSLDEAMAKGDRGHAPAGQAAAHLVAKMARSGVDLHGFCRELVGAGLSDTAVGLAVKTRPAGLELS